MKNYSFNAGRGSYKYAEDTFNMIKETRKKIANLLNADADDVVFTSSATESLNMIISGLNLTETDNVYISPFEHNSVIRTLKLKKSNIFIIPFDKEWKLNEGKFNDMLVLNRPKAIIISHISNVTGYQLPYEKIFEIGKKFDSINILDSAQGFGIYLINEKNVDMVVFAGHKSLYAMFGIAGFVNMGKIKLSVYKAGGTGSDTLNPNMPDIGYQRYEAGSLNSVAIYSINRSIDYLRKSNFKEIKYSLSKYFITKAKEFNFIKVYLPENYISNGIISFNIEGFKSDEIGLILGEEYNICVRTGYHCAPLIHDFIDSKKYSGTVRISFSGFNTFDEIDCLFNALERIAGE